MQSRKNKQNGSGPKGDLRNGDSNGHVDLDTSNGNNASVPLDANSVISPR